MIKIFSLSRSLHQPSSLPADRAPPPSASTGASPPPSLQRQDSGPPGIKGILKKSRSTSVESDHSEGSAPESAPTRQSSVALSHPESEEEEMAEEEEEVEEEEVVDEEEEIEEEETNREDESSAEDASDGACLSLSRQRTGGSSGGSSSRGSSEEMRSPSPDGSLEQTSTVSEDAEELEGSLDGSQGSRLKQRSALKHSRRKDEGVGVRSCFSLRGN